MRKGSLCSMILVMVMAALLFSQSAVAEVIFQVGEPVVTKIGEEQGPEAAAAAFKVVPLQAIATDLGGSPMPWWHLDVVYYAQGQFTVYGAGEFYTRVKVTDPKTGQFITFPKEGPHTYSAGNYLLSSNLSVSGNPSNLPFQFILTYQFKQAGAATWKNVSTKIILY